MQRHLQPAVDRFKTMTDEVKRSEFRQKLSSYVSLYSFLSQVIPYGDPALEMLYSFGRFLLPHLPLDRDTERVKLGDEVTLEFYRLQRIFSGEIALQDGDIKGVKGPTEVGTGRAKDEKVPLSEIIETLNERFATSFTEEDRLFFEQIKEKASKNPQVIQTALANPLDKFQLGIRKFIEEFMVQRMGENDKIVTRYMDDPEFQNAAFPILAKAIFEAVRSKAE
jgi:type I restriction enzyme R subunit